MELVSFYGTLTDTPMISSKFFARIFRSMKRVSTIYPYNLHSEGIRFDPRRRLPIPPDTSLCFPDEHFKTGHASFHIPPDWSISHNHAATFNGTIYTNSCITRCWNWTLNNFKTTSSNQKLVHDIKRISYRFTATFELFFDMPDIQGNARESNSPLHS